MVKPSVASWGAHNHIVILNSAKLTMIHFALADKPYNKLPFGVIFAVIYGHIMRLQSGKVRQYICYAALPRPRDHKRGVEALAFCASPSRGNVAAAQADTQA